MTDYSAIRALPEGLRASATQSGDLDVLAIKGTPWLSVKDCKARIVFQAAVEAQALLSEYEAQPKRLERAVELLKRVSDNRDELWESSCDEIFEQIEALLEGE